MLRRAAPKERSADDNVASKANEETMVASWTIDDATARLIYRFRPTQSVREQIKSGERVPGSLTLDDYRWEFSGGGPGDPVTVGWDDQLDSSVRWDGCSSSWSS
jgi:putative ATP-dependent endonuclease of OLD family